MNTENIKKIDYFLIGVVLVIGGIFYIKSRQAQSDNAPKAIVFPMVISTLKIDNQTGAL